MSKNVMGLASIFIASLIFFTGSKFAGAQDIKLSADFTLRDMHGIEVVLSSYRDKNPVLIFFWASWCPYCLSELRSLNEMYPDLEKQGIEVLAVNFRESKEKVDKISKRYGLKYRILLDKYGEASEIYDIIGLPTYVLLNKQGCIVFNDNYLPKQDYKLLIAKDCN